MLTRAVFFICISFFSGHLLAEDLIGTSVTRENMCEKTKQLAYNPIKGTIPLAYGHMPATDLVCDSDECGKGIRKGDLLTTAQADAYYKRRYRETRCQWTLSDLEPVANFESRHIWKGLPIEQATKQANIDNDQLELSDLDTVDYVSDAWARFGNYRITVNKANFFGTPKQYTVMLSKTIHNFLLRKALLRKLGYKVPPVKYVKRLKINFPSEQKKKDFIKDISINNAGSFDRWVLSENGNQIVVQDLIVMEDQVFDYNLSKGYLSEDVYQGKRIYDSLVLPFALVDVPESINLLDWTIGRRYSDNIVLKFKNAEQFNCSKDDATWMIRRLMHLKENDWQDIVDATELPPSVKLLLFEKLKSRRNHLAHLFGVQNINLPVDSVVSNSDDLVDGKIVQEFYDGYSRRFKIPDPESPLSGSEMRALFKSKAITTGLELLLNAFNSASFLGTDINDKIIGFNKKIAEKAADNLTTNSTGKLPIDTYVFPTVKGSLILNRDIIAGSHLGTDNRIQLVDTVGASLSVGVFGGMTGVYSKTGEEVITNEGVVRQQVPVDLYTKADAFVSRTYAHIKPITSIQKALKEKFRNMMVPFLKRDYGHLLDGLMTDFYESLTDEQKLAENKKRTNMIASHIDMIEFVQNGITNDTLYNKLKPQYEKIRKKFFDLKPEYIKAVDTKGIKYLNELAVLLADYYKLTQNLVKEQVLADGVCLNKEIEGEETKCVDIEVLTITPDNIALHYPVMSELLLAIDKVNDLNNYHALRLEGKQQERELQTVIEMFSEKLAVKESFIITDTIGASLAPGLGVNLYEVARVKANISTKKTILSRLHIHRASENEIHVYKDLGNVNSFEPSMGVDAFIPIVKFTVKGTKGRGRTKFYKIPIGPTLADKQPNVNRIDYLKALRNVFLTNSTTMLDNIKSPWVVTHNFKERKKQFGIFIWRWNWLKQSDRIIVTSPEGFQKKMYRRNHGSTSGRDFENYARDLVDVLIGEAFGTGYTIKSFNQGNPGYTYYGKAKNKAVTYEGIFDDQGKIEKPYVKLSRIHNGWKLSKAKALKILEEMKNRYKFRFVEKDVLAQTEKLFLYNINVNFYIYDEGLENMISHDKDTLKEIFLKYQQRNFTYKDTVDGRNKSGFNRFNGRAVAYREAKARNDVDDMAKYASECVEIAEERLKMAGISLLFGGGNFFANARVEGFRVGDPNGDKPLISNSFGRIGNENLNGPISSIKNFIGMTHGEFYMSWLLGRII